MIVCPVTSQRHSGVIFYLMLSLRIELAVSIALVHSESIVPKSICKGRYDKSLWNDIRLPKPQVYFRGWREIGVYSKERIGGQRGIEKQQYKIQSSHGVRNKVRNTYARLSYCCATVSIISLYLTIINHLFTNTYKIPFRFRRPTLYPIELQALHC